MASQFNDRLDKILLNGEDDEEEDIVEYLKRRDEERKKKLEAQKKQEEVRTPEPEKKKDSLIDKAGKLVNRIFPKTGELPKKDQIAKGTDRPKLSVKDDVDFSTKTEKLPKKSEIKKGKESEFLRLDTSKDVRFDQEGKVVPESLSSERDVTKDYMRGATRNMLRAGTGDLIAGGGYVGKWLGKDGAFVNMLINEGEKLQVLNEEQAKEIQWFDMMDPAFYATRLARTTPFMLALMPIGLMGMYGGATVATSLGFGTFGTAVLSGIGGAALSRPAESALEAGQVYDAALDKGMSPKEAHEAANKAFKGNMALTSLDFAQFASMAPGGVFTKGWVKALATTAKVTGNMFSEGAEEWIQNYISTKALGEEFEPFGKEAVESFVVGSAMGTAFSVTTSIINEVKEDVAGSFPDEFNQSVAKHKVDGMDDNTATIMALDDLAAKYPKEVEQISEATIKRMTGADMLEAQNIAIAEETDTQGSADVAEEGAVVGQATADETKTAEGAETLIEEAKKYKSAEEFVGAQGETLYHGTSGKFDDIASKRQLGDSVEPANIGGNSPFVFLSSNKKIADGYATKRMVNTGGVARTLEYKVSGKILDLTKSPLDYSGAEKELLSQIGQKLKDRSDGRGSDAKLGDAFIQLGKTHKFSTDATKPIVGFVDIEGSKHLEGILAENGISGFKFTDNTIIGGYSESVAVIPEALRTESQLTDIWNQARKTTTKADTAVPSGEERLGAIREYVDRKGTKFRIDKNGELLASDGKNLTTTFLELPEVRDRSTASYEFLFNLSNSKSANLKGKEKEIVQRTLQNYYLDEKNINIDEFRVHVLDELLDVNIKETSSYASHGSDNLGMSGTYKTTYILDSPFKHGEYGHFGGDFDRVISRDTVEVREIPIQIGNPNEKYVVVQKGVVLTEENLAANVYTITESKESAQQWIDNRSQGNNLRVDGGIGLFSHFRTFDNEDTSHVVEIQSDPFQKGLKSKRDQIEYKIASAERDAALHSAMARDLSAILRVAREGKIFDDLANIDDSFGDEASAVSVKYDVLHRYVREYFTNYTTTDKTFFAEKDNEFLERNLSNLKGRIEQEENMAQKAEAQVALYRKELADYEKNPNIWEERFFAYKNFWHERTVRESINVKAKEGKEAVRFPTPRTVAVLEGFASSEYSDEAMPYETPDGSRNDLTYGDVITYAGDDYTVVNVTVDQIVVAPSKDVIDFDANEAMQEDIEARWEETKSDFESVEMDFGKITTPEKAAEVIAAAEATQKFALFATKEKEIENIRFYGDGKQRELTDYDRSEIKKIEAREKPSAAEMKLIPKEIRDEIAKGQASSYRYGLDYYTNRILEDMSEQGSGVEVSIEDYYDQFYEWESSGYDPDYEGMYSEVYYEFDGRNDHVWAVTEGNSETFYQPGEYEDVKDADDFDLNDYSDEERTVLEFYDKQVNRYLQKYRRGNIELVTDDNGFEWYETKVTVDDLKPPTAFRLKDNLESVGITITNEQEAEIIKLNKKIFGDTNIKVMGQILANNEALGAYREGIIRILNKQASPTDTFYHEAVHKYLDIFTTRDEYIQILKEAQERYNIADIALVEERLAEDFIAYVNNRKTVRGKLKVFFDKVLARLRAYTKNNDRIEALYQDILSGKAKKIATQEEVVVTAEPKKQRRIFGRKKTATSHIYLKRTPENEASLEAVEPAKSPEELAERITQLNKFAQSHAILRKAGKVTSSSAAAQFVQPGGRKSTSGVAPEGEVRLRSKFIANAKDYVSALAHELGHAIEFNLLGSTNKRTMDVFGENLDAKTKETLRGELKAITVELVGEREYKAKLSYYNKQTELLARFFEKIMVSPSNLAEVAPTAMDLLEKQSIAHPLIAEFIEAAQNNIDKGTSKFALMADLRQTYQKHLGVRVGNIAYDAEITHRAMQERAKAVLTKFVESKFKGIKDDPAVLFRAAESIKISKGGVPEFGTRDFATAKSKEEEASLTEAGFVQVNTQVEDGVSYPVYARQRYTQEEGQAIFNSLSEKGKQLVIDFTAERSEAKDYFNREIIKDVNKVEGNIEGWVHHYFEDNTGTTVGKNLSFKERIAKSRRKRKGAEGYVEDFKKANIKALVDLEGAKVYKDFITRQFAIVTKPIPEGASADPGWVEVVGSPDYKGAGTPQEKRMTIIKDGKTFSPKQIRYQMPKEIYARYQLWKGVTEEASTAIKLVADLNKYWRINVLTHPGTTVTNAFSGGLQYGAKVLSDFYVETLTGDIAYEQTRKNTSAMIKALIPKGWAEAPDWVYGADQSNFYGQFTKQPTLSKGVSAYGDKALKLFGMVERYWKKVISLSEGVEDLKSLGEMTKEGLRLPTKEEQALIAEINKAVDLYAYDYDNVPAWLEAHQKSIAGQAIKPFAKYPYKYAKQITGMVGAAFDRNLPVQERMAKILTLTTMVAAYAALSAARDKERQTPEGTEETPARLSPRGRLFLGTAPDGKELFVRTAKYPFINLSSVGMALVNGEWEAAKDVVADTIGSIAPMAELTLLALDYRNKYDQYTPVEVIIGDTFSTYVPMFRVFNDISRMFDPFQRKQTTFGQSFTRLIPTTSDDLREKLHGDARTVRIPIEGDIRRTPGTPTTRTTIDAVLENYWADILLSLLTGIYITRIDPKEAEAFSIREETNASTKDTERTIEKYIETYKSSSGADAPSKVEVETQLVRELIGEPPYDKTQRKTRDNIIDKFRDGLK